MFDRGVNPPPNRNRVKEMNDLLRLISHYHVTEKEDIHAINMRFLLSFSAEKSFFDGSVGLLLIFVLNNENSPKYPIL